MKEKLIIFKYILNRFSTKKKKAQKKSSTNNYTTGDDGVRRTMKQHLRAFLFNQRRASFVIFSFRHPELMESAEGSQD